MNERSGIIADESKVSPEEKEITTSLQLELLSATLGLIANAIGVLALLESVEDIEKDAKKEQEAEADLKRQFTYMQAQIDELKREVAVFKKGTSY